MNNQEIWQEEIAAESQIEREREIQSHPEIEAAMKELTKLQEEEYALTTTEEEYEGLSFDIELAQKQVDQAEAKLKDLIKKHYGL